VVSTMVNVIGYISDQVTDSVKLGLILTLCVVGFISGRGFFHFTRTTPIFLAAMSLLIVLHITELTEEFTVFQQVPLFGEMTLAKRAFEMTLMIGSICLLLGGIYFSVFEINKARKQLDADVAQLKSLSSQLAITEERERRRIATELHDQIGQSLVFSKLKLDELQNSANTSELTKALNEISNNIIQLIQDTRMLTFDLSSPILNEIGFETAVSAWLDDQIQEKHGIKTEFEDDGEQKPLDKDIRAILFRNVRELLVNIVKHANAQKVKVSICKVDGQICVSVEDNGEGFEPAEVASKATFGLFSIRERLEQLDGSFEIKSEPGHGSKITMTAPLERA